MTSDQFTNWLSGFISALGSNPPTDEQFNIVKENLGKVFNKVTPNRSTGYFEQYAVPDCGLLNNDGVLGGHTLLKIPNLDPEEDFRVDLTYLC